MAEEGGVILITMDSKDLTKVIGAGRAPELPGWRDELFHSSNPALPLNDRSPRFLAVSSVYPTTSRSDLAIVEIASTSRLDRKGVPLMRVLGHIVEVRFELGTANHARESHRIEPFWEIRVDGKTIGGLDGKIDSLQALGDAAIGLAEDYIRRMTAEITHKF